MSSSAETRQRAAVFSRSRSDAAVEVEARNLHKSYRKGPVVVSVLRGAGLAVAKGEFLAIVGQSGSGKSTLLHLLGTLDAPDKGEIHFAGRRIDNLPPSARDALRNRQIGMIFQFYHLLPELTTLENVLTPAMIRYGVWSYLRRRGEHRAGGRIARNGRPGGAAETSPLRAFRRRNAARGDRPGADRPASTPLGGRADRQPRPGDGQGDHSHSPRLEPPAESHYSDGDSRSGRCGPGRPNRPPHRRPDRGVKGRVSGPLSLRERVRVRANPVESLLLRMVGWAERSEPHHYAAELCMVGLAALGPPYTNPATT